MTRGRSFWATYAESNVVQPKQNDAGPGGISGAACPNGRAARQERYLREKISGDLWHINKAYSSKTGVLVTQPANGAELPVSGVWSHRTS